MKTLVIKKIGDMRDVIPNNPDVEKRIIVGLFGLIITLAITYGYFVKQTISNVVFREQLSEEMSDLGSIVSNLEVEYISIKNKISLDFAYSIGYKEVKGIKFVSKNSLSQNLTLNSR
jgi:hypothetical protein